MSLRLTGGLIPENVTDAFKVHGVIDVDVSGGVETNGLKDHFKIKQYIKNASSSWGIIWSDIYTYKGYHWYHTKKNSC